MAFVLRIGENNILRSDQIPAIKIQIDPEFRYVGSTSFILYEVAHVEQHHFVVADDERRILRRLWFQFEGYLENNNHTYHYTNMEEITLNGFHFLHNAYPMNIDEEVRELPNSDAAHVSRFLKDKGYSLSGDILSHRMVWLDAALRNELMIIYSEALEPTGYRLSDLVKGGSATSEWMALSERLQKRSLACFKIL